MKAELNRKGFLNAIRIAEMKTG